jgi:hypothetical protein
VELVLWLDVLRQDLLLGGVLLELFNLVHGVHVARSHVARRVLLSLELFDSLHEVHVA